MFWYWLSWQVEVSRHMRMSLLTLRMFNESQLQRQGQLTAILEALYARGFKPLK